MTARLIFVLAWVALPVAAQPDEMRYLSAGGHQYRLQTNDHGAVLTSVYPVMRTSGTGAGFQFHEIEEQLFLGRSCDAFHTLFGDGSWGWANGGFVVEFTEYSHKFPRQDPPLAFDACRL